MNSSFTERLVVLSVVLSLCSAPLASAQTAAANKTAAVISVVKTGDEIAIESRGGALTYKAVLSGKEGGNITQVSLPADGPAIARELDDIFFHGTHGEEYTLRGWTGKSKFIISCSMNVVSQQPDEVVVQANVVAKGTFKIIAQDEAVKAKIKQTPLVSYKDKAVEIKRTYHFKADRVVESDELVW